MTLAADLRSEGRLGLKRFIHATRPRGPMNLEAAAALCMRMERVDIPCMDCMSPDECYQAGHCKARLDPA